MTSINIRSLHSSCSMMENYEDHQHKLKLSLSEQEAYAKYYSEQYRQGCYNRELHMQDQEKVEGINSTPAKDGNGLKVIICKKVEKQPEKSSAKWMSSKMRMMKKMRGSEYTNKKSKPKFEDHKQASSCIDSNNTIRVCTDCNTTKTPLWRSGPKGPKSLCNACGIRQRKARRALAAAAASGTVTEARSPMKSPKVQHKDVKSSEEIIMPFKKRFNVKAPAREKKKICFEDLRFNLSKHSALQGVFYPQDEKEGAILLMALSHGLVQG